MKYEITQDDINQYVANGGDLDFLTQAQISAIPQEILLKYVANGGRCAWCFEDYKIKITIPQDIVNQRAANGYDLDSLPYDAERKIQAVPQEIVNKYAQLGKDLSVFCDKQINAIPQEIVNQYAKDGKLDSFSRQQIDNIPSSIIMQYVRNGGVLDYLSKEQLSSIPELFLHEYIANGGNLYDLTKFKLMRLDFIPQDIINQRAQNGFRLGHLDFLPEEKIAAIPQEIVNERARNGQPLDGFTAEQIAAIPKKDFNQYVEKGGALNLNCISDSMIKSIPQKSINIRAMNGGDLTRLSKEQIDNIPQENLNMAVLYYKITADLVDEKRKNSIPKVILEPSYRAQKAIILYGAGKIKSDELPIELFANSETFVRLFYVVEQKLKQKFNQICEENGYTNEVPDSVVKAFDKQLDKLEDDIFDKRTAAIKQLTEEQKRVDAAINQITGLEW